MTLIDLGRLLGRYWYVAVILPVACALACGGHLLLQGRDASYAATSYVVAGNSAQLSTLNGTASSAAREFESDNAGYAASAKAEAASLTVTVTVTGPDADACADGANGVAEDAVAGAERLLGDGNVAASVERAYGAARSAGGSPWTYVLVAVLAGLFAAVVVVVAIDYVKRPVKGSADLAAASQLPVLEQLPARSGEHLLANVRFACGQEQPRTVCVVPSGAPVSAIAVAQLLSQAGAEEARTAPPGRVRPDVTACAPLSQGMQSAYAARRADAVVLTACQWGDSTKSVESTARELALAGANVVGAVLLKDGGKAARKDPADAPRR